MTITTGAPLVRCKHCPARAVWATFQTTGRRTLVDPQPSDSGNLALTRDKGAGLTARVVPPAERGQHEELYVSHFVTCPGANRGRRRQTPGRNPAKSAGPALGPEVLPLMPSSHKDSRR